MHCHCCLHHLGAADGVCVVVMNVFAVHRDDLVSDAAELIQLDCDSVHGVGLLCTLAGVVTEGGVCMAVACRAYSMSGCHRVHGGSLLCTQVAFVAVRMAIACCAYCLRE